MAGKKAKPVTKLHGLRINEVSLCDAGMNPEANVTIWKAKARTALDDFLKLAVEAVKGDMDGEAKDFNEAAQDQKARERLSTIYRMTDALWESVRSILEDDEVEDKDAMIRESVGQFNEALLAALTGGDMQKILDAAAGGTVTGGSGQGDMKGNEMSDKGKSPDNQGDVEKAKAEAEAKAKAEAELKKAVEAKEAENAELKKRLDALEDERKLEKAIEKAKTFSAVPGVTSDELAKAILVTPKEAMDVFEKALKAANEAISKGKLFEEFGSSATAQPGTGDDSPLVKAARADAEAIAKRHNNAA